MYTYKYYFYSMSILSSGYNIIQIFNNSKFFAGIIMIMLNIGSKYVVIELSETQKEYLRNSYARLFLLFAICWTGTRDVIVSLLLTGSFIIMTDYLLNEKSSYCIVPKSMRKLKSVIDVNDDLIITEEEVQNAIQILEKAKKKARKQDQMNFVNALRNNNFVI